MVGGASARSAALREDVRDAVGRLARQLFDRNSQVQTRLRVLRQLPKPAVSCSHNQGSAASGVVTFGIFDAATIAPKASQSDAAMAARASDSLGSAGRHLTDMDRGVLQDARLAKQRKADPVTLNVSARPQRPFAPPVAFAAGGLAAERFLGEMRVAASATGGLLEAANSRVSGLLRWVCVCVCVY